MAAPADLKSIDDFMRHWVSDRPDAVVLEEGDETLTFAQSEELGRRMVTALHRAGVEKGDRIAWLGKNAALYFQLLFSAGRAGIVTVPIGWRLAAPEVQFILRDTGAKILFAGEGFKDAAREAAGLPNPPRVVSAVEAREWFAASPPEPFAPAAPDDAVLQLYTSGTTGNPKGAVLSARNLFGLRAAAATADLPWQEYGDDEAILVCMPCAHIGGTGLGIMSLGAGIRGIVQPEFTPEGCLAGIEQGITRFFIVPAALQMVIQHPKAKQTDFSRLKYVMYGAAPIPLELLRQAVETISNADFLQCYGMTETTGTIAMLFPEDHSLEDGNPRMRSAGKALPGVEIRIVGEDGEELPRGQVGEIVTRSSNNMLGYWNLPEATASTLTADGWVHTGDAAYMDEDGYVYIQDRMKDMIISGGENVYPAEVESAIYGHPDIAEVAVIGVPDAKWGEAVKACVVPKPGHEIDAQGVIDWTRERIAGFKVPKSVDVIPLLPRNPSGKILRRQLREPYWEGFERRVN